MMEEKQNPLIGKVLGNCRIERLIGRGGHAAVFLAIQESLQRPVAVKVLLPQVEMSPSLRENFLARFQREAGVIAQLTHVNITHVYDYGRQDGLAYLVMPYYAGGSLQELLKQQGPLSLLQTLTYIEQAASALDYAHQHGVIHRDIKPANFLLASDGRLILTDFGIARLMIESLPASTLTGTGLILGTPEYMAPEMIQGKPVDLHADIYELGIVLFQMLSGKTPFKSTTAYSTMVMHLTEPVPALHAIRRAIPAAVDAVIQRATMKEPQLRFDSAGDLAQALRAAINGVYPHPAPGFSNDTRSVQTEAAPSEWPAAPPASAAPPTPVQRPPAPLPAIQPKWEIPQALPATPAPVSHPSVASSGRTATNRQTTGQDLSSISYSPTRRKGVPLPWFLFLLLALIGISITGVLLAVRSGQSTAQQPTVTITPTTIATATLTPEQVQIQTTLQHYYDSINNRDYQSAYHIWNNDPQSPSTCPAIGAPDNAYSKFANGYSTTVHTSIIFDGPPRLEPGLYVVLLTLHANEVTAAGTRTSTYYEQYSMVQRNGGWKIAKGDHYANPVIGATTPVAIPGSTPTDQARALVQQTYDAINQRNYPLAYSLFGSGFQQNDPYCNFADGYANTQRDDLTFNSVTQQADGSITVMMTILATESNATGTGTQQKTYNWTGTVGQENNLLKILHAVAS
ncbi:MAG TPA: serine/threonine-protein kinase [Ktedonosporobacter sp.]|nr:serine/threonine-protein kinase [Ktedonosporobacter sp.]